MADNAKRTRSPSIASTSPGSPSVSLTPSSVSSASSLQSSIKHESSDQEDDVLLVDTSPKKEVFSISRSRNFFADGPDQDKPYFISDIAEGQSDIPVRVLNTVDDTDYGSDVFIFTRDNIYQIPESKNVVGYCKCEGGRCDRRTCICIRNSTLKLSGNKIDPCQERVDYHQSVLYECCESCGCKGKCSNTFSSKSMPYRYEIFRRKHVGFGCRTLDKIGKGSFVAEFVGEVISKEQAKTRTIQSFMYTSYHHPTIDDRDTVIDPYNYGNVARFFNHSCNENLLPFRFFREYRFVDRPHIGFFAKRDIEHGVELTIDYGLDWWAMNINNNFIQYCCCDADYCVLPGPNRAQLTDEQMDEECEELEREIREYRKRIAELKKAAKLKAQAKKSNDEAKNARAVEAARRSTRNSNKAN